MPNRANVKVIKSSIILYKKQVPHMIRISITSMQTIRNEER